MMMVVVVIEVEVVVIITQENYLGESGFWADTRNKNIEVYKVTGKMALTFPGKEGKNKI